MPVYCIALTYIWLKDWKIGAITFCLLLDFFFIILFVSLFVCSYFSLIIFLIPKNVIDLKSPLLQSRTLDYLVRLLPFMDQLVKFASWVYFVVPIWLISLASSAWKASKFEVFSGSHFPEFGLNAESNSVNLLFQSKCRKVRTRKFPFSKIFYSAKGLFSTLSNLNFTGKVQKSLG